VAQALWPGSQEEEGKTTVMRKRAPCHGVGWAGEGGVRSLGEISRMVDGGGGGFSAYILGLSIPGVLEMSSLPGRSSR